MPTTTRPSCDVPSAANGAGTNSMTRLNYFNGRFLTAEALRTEQTYWDTRARLVAQIHPAGIAWGLSVSVASETFSLAPGLAFDGLGTPILVESPVGFTLADLLAAFELAPLTLQTTRGTNFVDCRCVTPSNGVTGPSAVQPGPYLLVIEPTEVACGEAKVYGTTCNTTTNLCETNGWKAGFRLSLVSLPSAPAISGDTSADAARGILSAWYFDTLENNLGTRHSAPFPDDTFCGGPGPSGRYASPVPLGMVYLGTGRALTFFDPWIPRRPIVGTATASWSTTALGAPTPSAAAARIHQFQCQLAQSETDGNLYTRGFRHIPPFGFLPVDLSGVSNGEDTLDLAFTNIRQLDEAEKQGKAWFEGTNVCTWCHVALHDDDLFEDLGDVYYKDPIFLREVTPVTCPDLSDPCLEGSRIGFQILNWLLAPRGLTVRALVNRETEIVKIIVPLQGLNRADPVEDPCATGSSTSAYSSAYAKSYAARLQAALGTTTSDWMPRQFVVYVKQRLVWMDVVFRIADALSDIAEYLGVLVAARVGNTGAEDAAINAWQPLVASFVSPKKQEQALSSDGQYTQSQSAAYVDTEGLRGILEARPLRALGYLRSAFDQLWGLCIVKDLIVRGAVDEIDGFDDPANWETYKGRLAEGQSRDDAIEYMLVEQGVSGFAVLKGMALLLRPSQVEAFEDAVYEAAEIKAENCPEEEPEPVDLLCSAIDGAVNLTADERERFLQLCCELEPDAHFAAELSDELVRLIGSVPVNKLPLYTATPPLTSTLSLAQVILTDADTATRNSLVENWVEPFAKEWCLCVTSLAEEANEAYGSESWSLFLSMLGTKRGCIYRFLPDAQLTEIIAWFTARSPTG